MCMKECRAVTWSPQNCNAVDTKLKKATGLIPLNASNIVESSVVVVYHKEKIGGTTCGNSGSGNSSENKYFIMAAMKFEEHELR